MSKSNFLERSPTITPANCLLVNVCCSQMSDLTHSERLHCRKPMSLTPVSLKHPTLCPIHTVKSQTLHGIFVINVLWISTRSTTYDSLSHVKKKKPKSSESFTFSASTSNPSSTLADFHPLIKQENEIHQICVSYGSGVFLNHLPPLHHCHLLMKVRSTPSPFRPPQGYYNAILIHLCLYNGFFLISSMLDVA